MRHCIATVAAVFAIAFAPLSLFAAQPLAVVNAMPQGEVRTLAQITVRFSEAMRPLGVMEQKADGAPLHLAVPGGALPAGAYRWLDPATLAYLFDSPVTGPVRIEASVPAGVKALSGAALAEEKRWRVSTPEIRITQRLRGGTELPPEGGVIFLTSNHPLRLDDLKAGTRLEMDGQSLPLDIEEDRVPAREGAARQYALRPQTELPPDRTLALILDAGIRPEQGSVPARAFRFTLKTYSALRVDQWSTPWTARGDKSLVRPESGLDIRFSNPVRLRDLLAHMQVSPDAPLRGVDGEDAKRRESRLDSAGRDHYLSFAWQPRTAYTVTLRAGLRDVYGTALALDAAHSFATGDLSPLFFLPDGAILEAKLGGLLPFFARNVGPVAVRLRFLPFAGDPAAAFADDPDGASGAQGARHKDLALVFEPNVLVRRVLNLPELLGSVGNGLVRLAMTLPDPDPDDTTARIETRKRALQVTDLGLTTKSGRENGLVWVTSLSGGSALEGVTLRLYAEKKGLFWQGVTDSLGLAVLPGGSTFPPGERVWLQAEKNGDTAVAALAGDTLPAPDHDYDGLPEKKRPWNVHMLTQLPLYQPGQTVRFTLYARAYSPAKEGGAAPEGWRPLAEGESVSYIVYDGRRKEVYRGQSMLNAYGSLSGQFPLPEEAGLGDYILEAKTPERSSGATARAFSVAAFRRPDFKVDVTPPQSQPIPPKGGKTLSASVAAGYFSGAALPGAAVALAVTARDSRFTPPSLYGYAVGAGGGYPRHERILPPHFRPGPEPTADLNAVLDAGGNASFTLPDIAAAPGRTADVSLEATVRDASGLASQGAASFTLHPSAAYVGIKAPHLAPAGMECTLELKGATFDDKPLSGTAVTLRVERRGPEDRYDPVTEKTVALSTPAGGRMAFTPPKGGVYRVQALVADAAGRTNLSETFIYAPGPGMDWGRLAEGVSLELIPDKTEYAAGDIARIAVKNPLAKEGETTLALVSVERNGVREAFVRELSGPAPLVDVPVTDKDAPYAYVSVLLVRGRTAPPPDGAETSGPDAGAPKVRLGVARLDLRTEKKPFSVMVNTDAAAYRPGARVAATVAVRGNGVGRKAQVTLLAVDNRALRAAGDRTRYDPSASFPPVFSYGITATDSRTRLVNLAAPDLRRMNPAAAAGFAQRQYATAAPAPEARGEPREAPPREDFRPDAFWLAQAETDGSGTLNASFTLPDSLTSYRIVAVAADRESGAFAAGETEIVAAKPLQLLSALPRFATEGDALSARVLVQNLGTADGEITVAATASGMTLDGRNTRSIRLAAGKSGAVSFPLRMDVAGTGALRLHATMRASGATETDAAIFRLPVLPAAPMTIVAAAGQLHADKAFTLPVKLPGTLDSRSRLDVIFAASPAAGLPLTARNLLEYPWDCLEQRLSRAWARILRLRHGELVGLPADPDDRDMIRKTLEAAPRFQKPDGGFALWPELDHSGLYLTAYALLLNQQAEGLGLGLDPGVAEKALRFLALRLRGEAAPHAADERAFALWALARHPAGEKDARALLPALLKEERKNPFGIGALLLASRTLAAPADAGTIAAGLLAELEKTAAVTAAQMHFAPAAPERVWRSMGSTLRDNGMVLWALALAKPDYPRLEALARWVSLGLGDRQAVSTQEGIFGLLGLTAYLDRAGGKHPAVLKALWNGRDSMSKSFERPVDPPWTWTLPAAKLPAGTETSLVLAADKGSPYWTARLTYAVPGLPSTPRNAGLTLTRAWDKPGPYRMGDAASVTLTLTVPAARRHVLVFDPFPAGMEPLRATRPDLQREQAREPRTYPGFSPWQRAELRDSGLLLYAGQMEPGTYTYTYTLRAAAPGTFIRRAARAEEMYAPEVFGQTAGERVDVTE